MLSRVKNRRCVVSSRPTLLIVEMPLEQRDAHAAVGDVGQRDDEEATRIEEFPQPAQS